MTRRPALLLTGGASRRLGTDKASIVWRGETLAARAARVLMHVCAPVHEVGPGVTSLPVVREDAPGTGPLAAALAGVRALEADAGADVDAVLVLACDMPFVEPPLLRLLASWPGAGTVIPTRDGRARIPLRAVRESVVARGRGVGEHVIQGRARGAVRTSPGVRVAGGRARARVRRHRHPVGPGT